LTSKEQRTAPTDNPRRSYWSLFSCAAERANSRTTVATKKKSYRLPTAQQYKDEINLPYRDSGKQQQYHSMLLNLRNASSYDFPIIIFRARHQDEIAATLKPGTSTKRWNSSLEIAMEMMKMLKIAIHSVDAASIINAI
jgi:hypothetical protein